MYNPESGQIVFGSDLLILLTGLAFLLVCSTS